MLYRASFQEYRFVICSRQRWFSRRLPLVVENKLAKQRNRFAGQPEFGMDKSRSTRAERPATARAFHRYYRCPVHRPDPHVGQVTKCHTVPSELFELRNGPTCALKTKHVEVRLNVIRATTRYNNARG